MNDQKDIKYLRYAIIKLTLTLFSILLCVSCNGQMKQEKKSQTKSTIYGDSIILNQYKDGKKDGLWKLFHKNGKVKSQGNYILDLKEGLHKEWDDDGILLLEGFYMKGKANGLMKWFHDKGHLAGEGNMIDDIRVEPRKICDIQENDFCIDAYFKNGKRDGIWKIYHESARDKIWKKQTFKDDKMISEKCWDENGSNVDCN